MREYAIQGNVGFERRVVREDNGGIPVHRPGKMIKQGTALKKLTIKYDWYSKSKDNVNVSNNVNKMKVWGDKRVYNKGIGCSRDPPSAPIFVPRTVGGPWQAN